MAVVDEQQARENAFGRRVADVIARGGGPIGWVVRPDDLEATARRLGLEVREGSRTKPSGERVEWRMAGLEAFASRPWLPFFIEWGDLGVFPGLTDAPRASIAHVEIEGDLDELRGWLGPHELPLELSEGTVGVTAVVLDGPKGTVTLGPRTSG